MSGTRFTGSVAFDVCVGVGIAVVFALVMVVASFGFMLFDLG